MAEEQKTAGEKQPYPKYDAGYKDALEEKSQFLHFIKKYVGADWMQGLTPEQIRFVDREYRLEDYEKRQADLIYEVDLHGRKLYLYILMELQSTVDYTMPFRILTLIFALMLKIFLETPEKERERRGFRLPVVIPVLFYNGEGSWTAETEYIRYLDGGELFGRHTLNYEYYLVDLSKISDEYILNTNTIIDNIMALDKGRETETLSGILERVAARMKELTGTEQIRFRKWLEQVLLAATEGENKEAVRAFVESLGKEEAQMMHGIQMAFLGEYNKGKDEGRRLGEGRFASLTNTLITLGRTEDLRKAAVDEAYRKSLYQEFEI